MTKFVLPSLMMLFLLGGCSSIKQSPKYELGDDYYTFRQRGAKPRTVAVFVHEDSIALFDKLAQKGRVIPLKGQDLYFTKPSLDIDVMTIPFKFRKESASLPNQLNTDFNGNMYVGCRIDRFKVKYLPTPVGQKQHIGHRGLTVGAFGGIGSTPVTPWTTNNLITDEYNGCILTGGLALMIGFHNHTAGLGIGWDHLTGRDQDIWIYRNKAWYGLTIGINLN